MRGPGISRAVRRSRSRPFQPAGVLGNVVEFSCLCTSNPSTFESRAKAWSFSDTEIASDGSAKVIELISSIIRDLLAPALCERPADCVLNILALAQPTSNLARSCHRHCRARPPAPLRRRSAPRRKPRKKASGDQNSFSAPAGRAVALATSVVIQSSPVENGLGSPWMRVCSQGGNVASDRKRPRSAA
jgi:hypothetical protein